MKKPEDFKKVTVIGGGFIGHSWSIVFARKGIPVSIYESNVDAIPNIIPRIQKGLDFLVEEGVLSDSTAKTALERITVTDDLNLALECTDYVQECVWENLALKQQVFKQVTDLAPADVPIGSSCSGLKISDIIKEVTVHPERCLVAHPTNPPHLIPFMEISGDHTDEEIKESVYQFMRYVGQKPSKCKEVYGYVLNRLQLSLIQEALYLVSENICDVAAVDSALSDGLGLRWAFTGPYGVEELNSSCLEEGLEKYKDYMIEFFTKEQKKVSDYDAVFIKDTVAQFNPIMKGMSHDEYLRWRDQMVVRTRLVKKDY